MRLFLLALASLPLVASAQPDLAWAWSPEPRWLDGVPANRTYFDGGLDYGANFVFSTVDDADVPPVEIVFDTAVTTLGRAFDYRAGLGDLGVGRFPGAAYDVSDPANPRRLNVGFLEDPQTRPPNGSWDPDGTTTGGHEYLLIFASDYDGTGETYAGQDAFDLDTYYGLAARVRDGRQLYESVATFALTPAPLRDVDATAIANGTAEVAWTAAAYTDATDLRVLDGAGALLATAAPDAGTARVAGLDASRVYELTVELSRSGTVLGSREARVRPVVSVGIEAVSSLDPGRAGASTYGDTWGYTAPDGTEYALLTGRGTGLSVIDITAAPAAPPVEVGFLASPPGASDAKDVKVHGDHAYVVHERGPVQIVSLTDPAAPTEVGLLDVQIGVNGGGSHNVLVADGKLWVVGGRTSGNAGVRVYDLADPTAPRELGAFQPTHQSVPYYHDFEVRGDRGYGPAIYDGGGVDVLDVSDPSDIRLLTTFTYPGAGAHNTCSTEDGNTVYVGDEIGSSGNWVRIFDVSDLSNVELVGQIVEDEHAVVHNCYVRGDRLFVAHYTEGLRVYDLTDPHAPVEVALYDTFLQPGYGYRGAWTAYPYFASGKVIVSDLQSGLFVVRLEEAAVAVEAEAPASAGLRAFPNPTAGRVTLAYALVAPARAEAVVVDVLGREVLRQPVDGAAGAHRVALAADLAPGRYVARLLVDGTARGTASLTVVR
ncbi:LVIVD repeat-containing protein [Rubrivirga sp. IMCC43871]|uniref:LVIVD repeat-containing protein n=1 Tax=Rubrivirga sp. IMCC43871 TaxID=3391575 RepID=UPI00398FA552